MSTAFFQRLLVQGAVDRAPDEACSALAGHGHVLVPALFSRLAGRKLFDDFGLLTETLLVSTRRNQVEVWSLSDPQLPTRLHAIDHGSELLAGIKREPSTQRLATWDRSGTVRRWEISDGSKVVG